MGRSADQLVEADAKLVCGASDWDDFLAARPCAGFMQSSWWAEFQSNRDWGHFGAVVRDGDEIAGGAQVLTRPLGPKNSFYYIPEGPVLPEDPSDAAMVFQMVMDSIDERRKREALTVCHLRIEPRWEALPRFVSGFRQRTGWNEPRTTLYIDLTPSEEDMLARMKPKGRYNVHLARRHGVSFSQAHSAVGCLAARFGFFRRVSR
jgi:lipid II:glycine glycyltransferase (peptidoglycan interpeptide bridge formation enzyme)